MIQLIRFNLEPLHFTVDEVSRIVPENSLLRIYTKDGKQHLGYMVKMD